MESKKILITGASGLLGRALVQNFKSASWEVIGFANSRAQNGLLKVNLLDTIQLEKIILDIKPTAIIHAAAERNCNAVDTNYNAAYVLNVNVSKQIAELAARIGALLIYISTDYVFDGTNPPYTEVSTPNPLNKYGVTKLEGEKVTLDAHSGALVLRVPLLYGPVEYLQESVVTGLLLNLQDRDKKSSISDYEVRYPTHVADVAKVSCKLLEAALKDPSVRGIYHCSGNESMTKYSMAKVMAQVLGLPMDHIIGDSSPTKGAPRPFDSHLDTTRLDNLIGAMYSPFHSAIKDCLVKFIPV